MRGGRPGLRERLKEEGVGSARAEGTVVEAGGRRARKVYRWQALATAAAAGEGEVGEKNGLKRRVNP